jgi:hypothetical protein
MRQFAVPPFAAKERFPADPWQLAFARNCGCGTSAVTGRPAAAAIGN